MDAELSAIQEQYPKLRRYPFKVLDSRGKGAEGDPRQMEFYPPDERDNPMPGYPTVEVFNPQLGGEELKRLVFGDMLHHLPRVDANFAQMRDQFSKTLTPQQKQTDREAYQFEKKNFGEKRTFEQWFKASRLDAYIRGRLAPDAADQWKDFYTPQQTQLLDRMHEYLKSKD